MNLLGVLCRNVLFLYLKLVIGGEMIERDAKSDDVYADKLVKILPPELTAVYFALRSLAGASSTDLSVPLLISAIVLAIVFYFISPKLINMTLVRNRVLYVLTFFVWIFAIDGMAFVVDLDLSENGKNVARFGFSALAAIWSFAVPYFMEKRD